MNLPTLGRHAPRPTASLRQRLLVGVVGAVVALWLGTAAFTWWEARHELDELLDAHLTQSAALLVAQQAHTIGEDDDDLLDAPRLHRYSQRVAFQVWHEGQLILRSPNAPSEAMSRSLSGFETRRIAGEDWRLFATRGVESDVQVYVAEQLDSRADIMWAVMRGLLGPLLLTLPLIALATWLAIGRGLRPLEVLSKLLAGRRPGELAPVELPGGAPHEMAPVLRALNGLFARMGTLIESERRFTADASHELRTPIAAIRTQAQVAQGATNEAERQQALLATLQGCDRTSHLVQQLLTLSRLDAAAPLQGTPVNLGALTRSVAGDLAPGAVARQQSLSLEAEDDCIVQGDETLLRVLLRNLLDNALRYSPNGASVALTVRHAPQGCELQVDDSGPGVAAADLVRLGERFFRPPGQAAAGSGLGWSIVQRIALAHGALVVASNGSDLGGLRVNVHFQAAPI